MPTGARQTVGENLWLPVCGRPEHAGMLALRRPSSDLDDEGIAQRRQANENWAGILYHGARMRRAY